MADYKINIEAVLNTAKAEQELQKFLKEDHKVELKTDIDNKQSINAGKRMGAEVQKGFSTNFNKAFSDMLSYKTANMAIDAMKKSVTAMVDEVTELDASLTEFNKVADLSSSGLEEFTKNAYSQASEIGRTGREMVDASTEFKKAGYTIDQSLNLGKSALMMTNIGDGISDVSAASSSLIAVMKGFKMQDSEAMNILDMINEVSNTQPIGFDNLTDGLTRISGTMNRSGNSIQETIGMLTGGFSSLRNMSKVATGLNTISATLRGMDEDGNAVDGLTSKLDSAFKEIGVNIIDPANGQLRSTFDIMQDYASVYDTLTDNQKQYYAELAANKRQAPVWDAMIQNWDTVTSSVTSATNSLGSATKENEIFRNSIKGMKNEFTNAFSTLAQETIDDEWIKNVIEGATNLLETLGNIAGQDTLIGDVISGATEGFKDLSSVLNSLSENDFLATVAQYFLAFKGLKTGAGLVKTMMGIGKEGALLSNIFGTGTEKAEEYGEAINNLSNLTITAGTSISGMKSSLTGGIKALTAFAKANPVTAVAAGVATAGLIGLKVYNRYKENMIEGATEASKAWNDKLTGLQDQMSQVQELRLKLNTEDLSDAEIIDIKSQILEIQSQITSAYGEQASGIDLVNGNLQTQLDLVNSISGSEAKKSINQNKAVYEDAKREMTKDDRSYMLGDVAQSIDAGGVAKDIYDIANDIEGITPNENDTGAFTIHFKGDVTQADESINSFMTRVGDLREKYKTDQYATDIIDNVLGYSQTSLEDVSNTLEKYQDNYNSYLQQSMFAKGTGKNSPAGIFNDYADAVKKYNDALMSGDASQVYEARAAFNDVKTNVDGVLSKYPEYQQLFDDGGQQLDETASKSFDFQEAIQGTVNKDNMFSKSAKDVDKFGSKLKKLNLDTADVVDALMTKGDQQGESYIQGLADVWGLEADATAEQIQAFADVLANAGVVSNGTAEDIAAVSSSYDNLNQSLQNAITNQEAVNTAVQNSVSATGLTSDDITNLSNIYGEYEGFESIFERSANGVQLNRDALNALEQQQESLIKQDFAESIREQQKAYEDAQKAYKDAKKDSTVSDADRAALKVSMDDAKTQLENIKMLSSVYDGLTSSYNKWMSASSDTEEGARFDNVMSKFQNAQSLREQGLIGTEEFRGAVDYFWSGDASLLNAQELKKTYDELNPLISDWYQLNEDGSANNDASIKAFRDDAKQLSDILGKPVNTSFDELEDGTKKATLNAKEFADAWGVSEDVVQDVAGKMRDYGWDVEVTGITDSSENIKELAKNAEEAQSKLKRLTGETYEWDFNTTDAQKATEQVQKATEQLQQFKKSTGEYDYSQSGATEAAQVYEAVVRQEQLAIKPAISNVDTSSVVESSQNWVTAAQNFQTAKDELDVQTQLANQGLQNDVENATKTANEALTNLQEISKNGSPFDIDTSSIQEAENSLAGISEKDLQMKVGADTSDAESSVEGIANEEVEVPVTVQLEEGQFSALMEGITGEEYEATVTVNEEKGTDVTSEQPEPTTQQVDREVNEGDTSKEPKPVKQEVKREVSDNTSIGDVETQQGGVITYQSKVEKPEVPDVKGKTVLYKSKVQKPVVPDVEGKTVIYKAEVEDASVPTLEGTVIYEGKFPKSAPVLNGTVNYSSNSPSEVSAASGTANFTLGSSPKEVPPAQGIANFSLGSSPTTVPSASGVANFSLGRYPTSLPAITQTVIANKVGFASGTMLSPAHADGTAYNVINYKSAYADGKVSLPHDEKALVNEMGTESIIRDGKWMLIPGGMHVQSLKKGDIVLNASQTADLLKYGKASGHGKAYAQGTVGKGKVVANAYASGTKSKWERAVDWIERLLTKLELTAELAGLKSENRTSIKNKNSYIDKQYKTTSSLITANQKAAKAYHKAAGTVGLSRDLKKKVREGNYNIQDYSEATQQNIKDYQEMIDKASECTKAVEELKKQQKELEQTKLDNVVNYYDSINSKLEAQQSIYSAQQKFYQESGHGGNEQERKIINEQLKLQKLITKNLEKEEDNYYKQLKSAKKKFGENSNEYREALAKYYEIKSAKVESQTSEENLKNQRREISYSLKQYIIDGFERIASRLSANEKYYTANNASVNTRIGNYDKQIDNYNDQIYAKRQLQKLYINRMAQLHVNDAEYQETADKVAKLDEEIINLAMDIEEAKDSIRKARWEAFNDNMTSLNNRITENDEIRKMLNQNGMVNREDGTLNADGYANILLIAKGMELNNQKIADYKVALSKVKEELDNGVISQSEYNEYVNQYQSEIRKAASANKDYSDSLISMYKTQIKYENEALQDNIKKRKEALSAKDDYYQYDRKIKTQTKDINTLKAQIAALEGATNAADKARKRLLEEQLSQKQDDLNDDVRSHRVDLMTSGYDKLSQSASETMNNTLDELETNTEAQKQCVDNMLAYLERGFSSTGESISSAMGEASESIVTGFESALSRISSLLEDTAIKVSDAFSKAINSSTSVTNPNNASADKTTTDINTDAVSGLDESNNSIVNDSASGKNAKPIHVTSIKLSKTSITLTEGQSEKIKVTVSPSNASEKSVTCSGGNSNVSASISGSTLVLKGLKSTGKGNPITITVKTVDSVAKKATIKVKVRTKTAENLASKAGKGKTNTGKSLVNKTLKKYDYGAFSTQQQLQLAKDYGIKATASNIYSKDIQTKLADKLKTRFIKDEISSIIKSLPDENRTSKEISKISALGQHVSKNHKKRLTKAGSVELAKAVGLKYSSNYDKWTSKQKNELLSKLKNYGFSSGGIVKKGRYLPVDGFAEMMKKAAINNGDDGWISVKRGEEILNNDQVKEQIKLANHVMAQSKMYEMQTKMLEGIINNSSSVSENNNNVIYYDSFLKVEGNITEDVLPKVESMIKQNIEAAQSSAFKDISKQFSKEFDKLGMRRRR